MTRYFKNLPIRFKFIFSGLILVFITMLIVVTPSYYSVEKNTLKLLGQKLERIASTGALLIPVQEHQMVYNDYLQRKKDIEQTTHFKKIKKILKDIKRVNNLQTDVYTLVKPSWIKNKIIFLVMDNDESYVGNSVELNKFARKAFEEGIAINTPLYEDAQGTWMSAFSPLKDETGAVVALLEIDFRADEEIYVQRKKILESFVIPFLVAFALAVLLGFFIGAKISQPIVELCESSKIIADGDYDTVIPPHQSKDEIGELYRNFVIMLDKIKESRKKLEEHNRDLELLIDERTVELKNKNLLLSAILDSLDQGLVIFEADGICKPTFTSICLDILEKNPANLHLSDVLKEDKESLDRWLKVLFDELLPFNEMILGAPGKFAHSKGRFIDLKYREVRGEQKKLDKVVLIATDKTEEHRAIEESKKKESYIEMIITIIRNKGQLSLFIDETREKLSEIDKILASYKANTEIDLEVLYRYIHTIKGGAASLFIYNISNLAHELESDLSELTSFDDKKLRIFELKLKNLKEFFNEYLIEIENILGDNFIDNKMIHIDRRELSTLISKLPINLQSKAIKDYLYTPIEKYFDHHNEMIKRISEKSGKSLGIIIFEGEKVSLPSDAYKSFFASLVHCFRNAVDHGIETREERVSKGKTEQGSIIVETNTVKNSNGDWLSLIIKDDGAGINIAALREKLIQNGESVEEESDHSISQWIFRDHISLKREISDISGRGIGMSAVSYEVEKLGGRVEVFSEENKGTEIRFMLPLPNKLNYT